MTYRYVPAASRELREAAAYYESNVEGLHSPYSTVMRHPIGLA